MHLVKPEVFVHIALSHCEVNLHSEWRFCWNWSRNFVRGHGIESIVILWGFNWNFINKKPNAHFHQFWLFNVRFAWSIRAHKYKWHPTIHKRTNWKRNALKSPTNTNAIGLFYEIEKSVKAPEPFFHHRKLFRDLFMVLPSLSYQLQLRLQKTNEWYCSMNNLDQGSQTRGPHVAREGVFCGPRCFLGNFKRLTFALFTLFSGV